MWYTTACGSGRYYASRHSAVEGKRYFPWYMLVSDIFVCLDCVPRNDCEIASAFAAQQFFFPPRRSAGAGGSTRRLRRRRTKATYRNTRTPIYCCLHVLCIVICTRYLVRFRGLDHVLYRGTRRAMNKLEAHCCLAFYTGLSPDLSYNSSNPIR